MNWDRCYIRTWVRGHYRWAKIGKKKVKRWIKGYWKKKFFLYGFLDLHFDERFTIEEKCSIILSNPSIFGIGINKDIQVVIVAGLIMELIKVVK